MLYKTRQISKTSFIQFQFQSVTPFCFYTDSDLDRKVSSVSVFILLPIVRKLKFE
jgi:hypothetical protein